MAPALLEGLVRADCKRHCVLPECCSIPNEHEHHFSGLDLPLMLGALFCWVEVTAAKDWFLSETNPKKKTALLMLLNPGAWPVGNVAAERTNAWAWPAEQPTRLARVGT